ncbi:MAG: DUF2628 domain-containing protein [bacterium]
MTFRFVAAALLVALAVMLWMAYSRARLAVAIRRALSREVAVPVRADPADLYDRPSPPQLSWNWPALVLGPFWYVFQGLWVHSIVLASLAFLSGGLLAPLVWLYAGLKADEDLLEFRIARRSVY